MPESPAKSTQQRQSLAQQRAAHALKQIQRLEEAAENEKPEKVYGKYVSYVSALPATIIRSGLGQALAMERAGAKLKGHQMLFSHILAWLQDWENSPYGKEIRKADSSKKDAELFTQIANKTEQEYIRAQAEVLEYLEWLKKFAVALLKTKIEEEDGE